MKSGYESSGGNENPCPFGSASSSLAEGTINMILNKIHFAIDKTTKTNASQKVLLKRYRNYSPNQSDVIVVIGGDGFMLETLK